MRKKIKPIFIGLYDAKLLGIRYLSSTLKGKGYEPQIIFLKSFNSYNVDEPTPAEYELLYEKIKELSPGYIGLSIMCSFYLAVAKKIVSDIRAFTDAPVILGGAYPTLFPEECLELSDMVFRGEGEDAILEFSEALENGQALSDITGIENTVYKTADGEIRHIPLRPLIQDLDRLPHPDFGGDNIYYINNDKLSPGDPEVQSFSYEMTTSRGCPNRCSYCSNSSIRALYKGKGKYIRQRSVDDVMGELLDVRKKSPGLQMLRFWDEIFPWDVNWVEAFAARYEKEICLPFEIWGHPKLSAGPHIKRLVKAGLSKIVIGVQSGCPEIRREIYHRGETQAEILKCAQSLSEAKVPIVVYDFILGHPFETEKDLRETLELCRKLAKPFRLQLHGLSFLPGTPIEEIAVSRGVKTWEEIHAEQARPLREQYRAMHWWRRGRGGEQNAEKTYWYTLIYLTQFKTGERVIRWALNNEKLKKDAGMLLLIHRLYNYRLMFRAGTHKLGYMVKRKLLRK
ncbi:MAG: B12-binding domain-containing radical SAM protein [Clostridiales bacterium]|jgi:radical SAM superfamily enzyme YgiQ (UPF0313 family)|nr:B12-binding domain-containing radical SAM protein [Clostridiales bacterium]